MVFETTPLSTILPVLSSRLHAMARAFNCFSSCGGAFRTAGVCAKFGSIASCAVSERRVATETNKTSEHTLLLHAPLKVVYTLSPSVRPKRPWAGEYPTSFPEGPRSAPSPSKTCVDRSGAVRVSSVLVDASLLDTSRPNEPTAMSSRAEALVDRADELEQCGQPQAACRAYQAALHLDPHCRAAAVNLGVLLKCVDRLPACRAAYRHAAALHAQLRLNEPQRLCDGGTGMLKAAVVGGATAAALGLLSSCCLAASGWLSSAGSPARGQLRCPASSAHLIPVPSNQH
jgi:hypothetical protein